MINTCYTPYIPIENTWKHYITEFTRWVHKMVVISRLLLTVPGKGPLPPAVSSRLRGTYRSGDCGGQPADESSRSQTSGSWAGFIWAILIWGYMGCNPCRFVLNYRNIYIYGSTKGPGCFTATLHCHQTWQAGKLSICLSVYLSVYLSVCLSII